MTFGGKRQIADCGTSPRKRRVPSPEAAARTAPEEPDLEKRTSTASRRRDTARTAPKSPNPERPLPVPRRRPKLPRQWKR